MNIYLDNNATTKLDPLVREAMLPFLGSVFGNPSSIHSHGQSTRFAVDTARANVASLINSEPEEIVFTSGGTEACNLAVFGHCRNAGKSVKLLAGRAEHPAVINSVEYIRKEGLAEVEWINILADGTVDLADLEKKMNCKPSLVIVMTANNDTGAVMPVKKAAEIAHAGGALFFTDAVQAAGKIPVDVKDIDADFLSFSAHKLNGPQGSGALFIKQGVRITPLMFGGHQENRRRPGTENVSGISGFGAACELALKEMDNRKSYISSLRKQLEEGLCSIYNVSIFSRDSARLPGTCYAGFPGFIGEMLQMALDMKGFSVSAGSACSSDLKEPSHVLTAMGIMESEALSALRFSIGHENTEQEIEMLLSALKVILFREH